MDFTYEIPKRKYLCNFSIATNIYDTELSNKIKEKFCSLELSPNPDASYVIEISFDLKIYSDIQFYKFPVERNQAQLERLKQQTPQEKAHTIIGEVLSQQAHTICKELPTKDVPYRSVIIAGESKNDLNRVDFCIYEDMFAPPKTEETTSKKSKRKETIYVTYSIVPDRAYIAEKGAKVLAEQILRRAEEEYRKSLEKSAHTPNMVSADKIFTALATAILEEKRENKHSSPELLAYEMVAKAHLKSDWPLEIVGNDSFIPEKSPINVDTKIDCPEFLIFVKRKNYWSLQKVNDLSTAKHIILSNGYNQKSIEQIVVLHNLQKVSFNLFAENDGEIVPIEKSEAPNAKKLLLSWCQ